jgi:hypothetical protein
MVNCQRCFITSIFCAALSWAQGGGAAVEARSVQSGGGHFRMTFGGLQSNRPTVIGAPYSGEEVSEHTQTLSDGTHIAQKMRSQLVYRDSQGRTRTERPVMMGPNADPDLRIVEIHDPIAGYSYVLDPANRIVHRVKLRDAPRAGGVVGVVSSAPPQWFETTAPPPSAGNRISVSSTASSSMIRGDSSTESLGAQSIEGVLAEGRRHTTTIPVNAQGNDRPIVSTIETWISPDLKVMILTKHTDPRNGETTTKLTNISRVEPDATLFQPPSSYKIVDEEGQFTIEMTRP